MKSALATTGVNFEYILNYDELLPKPGCDLLPSTAALSWCMQACSVNRIFCEADLNEFLFRLPIVLNELGVLTNWFGHEELFGYQIGENRYAFCVHDIFRHYGIETCDAIENFANREWFLDNELRHKIVSDSKLIGFFRGIQVLPLHVIKNFETDEVVVHLSNDMDSETITEKQMSDAEFFALDIMKLAPTTLFEYQDRFGKKLEEIELRKQQIASIPKFDLEMIPLEIRRKCMELMFDPEWVKSCQDEDDEDYKDYERTHIYLAWLFANDLMVKGSYGLPEPVEGVDFEFTDYALEDGGFNLELTYDSFNIQEVEPLLKGVLFLKSIK